MKFSFSWEDINFSINIQPTSDKALSAYQIGLSKQDKIDIKEDLAALFDVFIESSKESVQMTHLFQGVPLGKSSESMQEEIELMLDEGGWMDDIIKHWQLQELEEGPSWRES